MTTTTVNAAIPELTPALVARVVSALADEVRGARVESVDRVEGYSNDLAEVRFDDGRALMIKRARFDWAAKRFEVSRLASALLRGQAGLLAPRHLESERRGLPAGVAAYWRIQRPTLAELWTGLPRDDRPAVVRSWGRALRRAHEVRVAGHGALPAAAFGGGTLGDFLDRDLNGRLAPAVAVTWRAGRRVVRRLVEMLPAVAGRVDGVGRGPGGGPGAADGAFADGGARDRRSGPGGDVLAPERPTLVHADMHMGNVLCERDEGRVRCVGFIDLESAWCGPAAVDLASASIMHGPLFAQPEPEPGFTRHLLRGYGRAPDPLLMRFFRAYHYANVGYYAALTGNREHAAAISSAARAELAGRRAAALPRG